MSEHLAYTVRQACAAAALSRSYPYAQRKGQLQARRRGRRVIILARDLEDRLDRLPSANTEKRAA
jgi:hypothetical protein